MLLRFFALLKMTGAFVCFLDSYLLFFLFGLSNSLRIRGYLIKYPRIFHHVSVDISLHIHGYAKFLLCPRDLLVVCSWVLSYWWLFFCFTQTPQTFADSFFTECFFTQKAQEITDFGALLRSHRHPGCVHSAKPVAASEATQPFCEFCVVCVRPK